MKFNIGKFLLGVGKGIIKELPGGDLALTAINALLPEDKKLSSDATGEQAQSAIDTLPAEQKAFVLGKEIELEIAQSNNWADIQRSHSEADKAGSSTRPEIAKMMAYLIAYSDGLFISLVCYAVGVDNIKMIGQLQDLTFLITAVLGTPTALLLAYFGMRTREKRARYQAATGQPQPANLLTNLLGAFRRK